MVIFERDPDVLRWGLYKLLPSDQFATTGFCEVDSQRVVICYDGESSQENNFDFRPIMVENDEIIAHTLQEELSHTAAAEASGACEQESVLAQNWLDLTTQNTNTGNEYICERNDMGTSSSSSSPRAKPLDGDKCSLELADDYFTLDGAVGKKFSQMVPIPHIPRTNGDIPSVDEATSDHQRLLNRLHLYNLVEMKVEGDGNCQFRALSDQFYRTPEHHKFLREQVVNQLTSHPDVYEGYVPMAFDDYLKKMAKSGEWGDHVTLQAAADLYGVKIFVMTSFKDTCYIEILPSVLKSERVIFLSFWAEVHYNSIYPDGELPTSEGKKKKKKRWWQFGNSKH